MFKIVANIVFSYILGSNIVFFFGIFIYLNCDQISLFYFWNSILAFHNWASYRFLYSFWCSSWAKYHLFTFKILFWNSKLGLISIFFYIFWYSNREQNIALFTFQILFWYSKLGWISLFYILIYSNWGQISLFFNMFWCSNWDQNRLFT